MSDSITTRIIEPALDAGHKLLRGSAALYDVDDSTVLEVRGDDRKAWLQGQVTNDLRKLEVGGSLHFCFCSPTGQLLANGMIWSLPDRHIVIVPRECVEAVLDRFNTMVVMEDVDARDITGQYRWVTVQGPSATSELSALVDLPTLDAGSIDDGEDRPLALRNNRTGLGGWDLLLPLGSDVLATELRSRFETAPFESVEVARIEAGIPRYGVDMGAKTLPPEMGPDFEFKHISYSKGCYTGQEVLMRIHSRGHTNRSWVALLLNELVEPGAIVTHGMRSDAGIVTCVANSPTYGHIAAAMVRNEIALKGEPITVSWADRVVSGEIHLMPLLPGF